MSVPELIIAGGCGALGVRSVIVSLRRPFEPADLRDRLLYALYVSCRAGWWFTLGLLFLGYGLVEQPQDLRWFLLVPIALGGIQLLSSLGLAHGGDRDSGQPPDPELNGHEPPGEKA